MDEWQDRAVQRIEYFRKGFSYELQVGRMSGDFRSSLIRKVFIQKRDLNEKMVWNEFQKAFPSSHRPAGTRLYVFSLKNGIIPEILRGEGLSDNRGKFIVSLFTGMIRFNQLPLGEKKSINERCQKLFGESLSAEIIANVRKGKLIRGFFEEKKVNFVWDSVSHGERIAGGFLAVFPDEVEQSSKPLRFALEKYAWENAEEMVPILMPVETASSSLSPVYLDNLIGAETHVSIRRELNRVKSYDRIASSGTVMESGDQSWVLRSAVSINLPYEIWMTTGTPEKFLPRIFPLDKAFGFIWLIFWLQFFRRFFVSNKPPYISMRQYFAGFIFLIGAIPLSILLVIGLHMLENSRDSQIGESIRRQVNLLEEVDSQSLAKLAQFTELGKRFVFDRDFKAAVCSPGLSLQTPKIRECFGAFRGEGLPLESLTSFQYGKEWYFLSELKDSANEKNAVFSFFQPILYGCFRFLEMDRYEEIIAPLKETTRLLMDAFNLSAVESIYSDLTIMRNIAQTFDYDGERYLTFFDFLSNQGKVQASILFRCKPSRTFVPFLQKKIQDLSLYQKNSLFAFGKSTPDGFLYSTNFSGSRSRWKHGSTTLLARMNHVAKTEVLQIFRRGNNVFIAYPCQRMPNHVLGVWFSLARIHKTMDKYKYWLFALTSFLALITVFVAVSMGKYFLEPVTIIEGGLKKVSEGNLNIQLNLDRDDELGDASAAFDEMIQGLQERQELGRFVSATLETSIRESRGAEVSSYTRIGVVLASDIRNFTTHSENNPPELIVDMLNNHLEMMSQAIKQNGGLIDKFIGDAIIAIFWHDDLETALRQAMNAGLQMMRAHAGIHQERCRNGLFSYGMGVGIAVGELEVGAFGSKERFEYTVIGEVRHLSEELEALSKAGKFTHIIVEDGIPEKCPGFSFAKLKDSPHYELLDSEAAV